ncbi:MAG: carbohydrate ABC transporter permease, partial [Candidatus Omnitrophica bacterium]|nr:carbohydrate ABC transporter permease [Candidatus Omnitrophota bacterium]
MLAMVILQDKAKMPLQRGLMIFQGAYMTDYPLLMAGITITVVPVIIVYLFMQKNIISGITAGAVKG